MMLEVWIFIILFWVIALFIVVPRIVYYIRRHLDSLQVPKKPKLPGRMG